MKVATAQNNLERVTLEWEGEGSAMFLDDTNLDNALTWTINAVPARSGQVCMAAARIHVQRSTSESFIEKYVEKMKTATKRLGNLQDMSVTMGSPVDRTQFERVKNMVEKG